MNSVAYALSAVPSGFRSEVAPHREPICYFAATLLKALLSSKHSLHALHSVMVIHVCLQPS